MIIVLRKLANPGFFPYKDEGFYNPISVGDYNHDGIRTLL